MSSGQKPESDALAATLAQHYPHLFGCVCGVQTTVRPLPDKGEREAAWAAHVADVLRGTQPEPSRCEACRGVGKRVHGWAICPRPCQDCGGTGMVTPPAQVDQP